MHHLKRILQELPAGVKLVVVSKTVSVETIQEVYNDGHRIFGENRAQALIEKQPVLPGDIEWHFIGHLQSNKVKYIAPFVSMIHSVDSLKLLKEIDKEGAKNDRVIPCLLQFHIASEETKYGLDLPEAVDILADPEVHELQHVTIAGVMGMATFSEDDKLVRQEFRHLKSIFTSLKENFFPYDSSFSEISMGMSGDYKIAVEEGSTIVRIGTAVFS
jgi:pyridoxal phosphate enzyme (YggS family)